MTRVLNRLALGVRIVGFQSDINADLPTRRNMFNLSLSLNSKLTIVAIRTMDNADSFDVPGGKGANRLLGIAHQSQASNTTAIGEGDVLAIRLQLPTCLLVFNRAVIMLELRITLLAWLLHLTVLIEAGDSKPGTIC